MNTRFFIAVTIVVFLFNSFLYAKSGCCSHHGGVAGCNSTTEFYICADGTDSASCTCGYTGNHNSFNSNDSNSNSGKKSNDQSIDCHAVPKPDARVLP